MTTTSNVSVIRRFPVGAEVSKQGTHFRVWAPARKSVEVVWQRCEPKLRAQKLEPEADGYFSGLASDARAGDLYRFRLDDEDTLYPDPASRFQPEGPHGPSEIIDPNTFLWSDRDWPGVAIHGQVIYEMHLGTFTPDGTWNSAAEKLPLLAEMGITVLEVMPVADFPGRFGWGYDGVDFFAPSRIYGRPDNMRRFIDTAHSLGLGVILDVVYNHFGPSGNYWSQFSPDYFSDRHKNEWGEALNFDGHNAAQAREFYLANAAYWTDEFHLDGLRLDATQQIFDSSSKHILQEIGERVRAAARGRKTIVVTENDEQTSRIARPVERGGYGLDGLWNDDFHHSAVVALTGHSEAYYTDYHGTPQELISAVKYGYLYQGQWYSWRKQRRGEPALDLKPPVFVAYIENHDQVANSARGLRLHQLTSPGRFRAMTALLLLGPNTPMLFQGQEFSSSKPFLFFADHEPELRNVVRQGRAEFLSQFRSIATPECRKILANPTDPATFEACKLDWSERDANCDSVYLHRDLLWLRRSDPVFRAQAAFGMDGTVLARNAFVLRFFGEQEGDRLLVVNLGRDLLLSSPSEPLLAPPQDSAWQLMWSSEDPRYGGNGTPAVDAVDAEGGFRIPGQAIVVLKSAPIQSQK